MGKEVKSRSRKSQVQSGSNGSPKLEKMASSKIEHTKSTPTISVGEESRVEKIRDAAAEYRANIEDSGRIVAEDVMRKFKNNLLKCKLVVRLAHE